MNPTSNHFAEPATNAKGNGDAVAVDSRFRDENGGPRESISSGRSIREEHPLEDSQWDARLSSCRSASFFHSSAWASVLHDTHGFVPVYFTFGDAKGLKSLLALMEVDSWLTKRRGVSLPFTDACAPLGEDSASLANLFDRALEYGEKRRWRYMEVRGGSTMFGGSRVSTSYFGHRLDLSNGESSLFAKFEGSVRQAIRKAQRNGLNIEFSRSQDALRAFYGLFCKTRKRVGLPPQPFRFFLNIHQHVLDKNKGWVVLARHGQVTVAGAVFFHFGKTAIFKFGASDYAFQHLRATNLVMWEAIKHYSHEGMTVLDFGRTSLGNDGLRMFKLGWGAREHSIDYVKFDLQKRDFVASKDISFGLQNRLFQMLPISISRLIGATLYRHTA